VSNFSGVHLLILLALVAVVVLVVVFAVRRWRRTGTDSVIAVTLTLAALYAVLGVLGAVGTFIALVASNPLAMSVPVDPYWPTLPDGVKLTTTGPTATVAGGGFTTADVSVKGASTGVHVLWATGQALDVLVPAVIAGLIALACFQLLRGAAFSPVMARAALITAAVVLVGGIGAEVLSELAGSLASAELFQITTTEATGLPDGFDITALLPQSAVRLTIPLWPIGAALGFAALAAIFRSGSRLQHDTELLV
jgi:hypothetical protein